MGRIALCADLEALIRPALMGLEGINLEATTWIEPFADAAAARSGIASGDGFDEAWVVSSEDMAPVNLAATLHSDAPSLPIYLVMMNPSGSESSRARQVGITGILDVMQFARRFEGEMRSRSLANLIEVAEIDEPLIEEPPVDIPSVDGPPAEDASRISAGTPAPNTQPLSGRKAEKKTAKQSSDGMHGFVLAFLSGSGGVGKSTSVAVASYLTAARGYKTAALDCDLQFGDLGQIMPDAKRISVDDVLAGEERLSEFASELEAATPALITAPSRLESSEELSSHIQELIAICAGQFDVVIVNTGSNWTECHAQLLECASRAVFLLDQRASSVRSCKHALDLCMRLGIAAGSFEYALNRCCKGALFNALDVSNAMDGAHVFELKDGGSEVEELLGAGLASELAAGRNDFCSSVESMLDELLPGGRMPSVKRRGRSRKPKRDVAGAFSLEDLVIQ